MDCSTDLQISEMWFKDFRWRGFPTKSFIMIRNKQIKEKERQKKQQIQKGTQRWTEAETKPTLDEEYKRNGTLSI